MASSKPFLFFIFCRLSAEILCVLYLGKHFLREMRAGLHLTNETQLYLLPTTRCKLLQTNISDYVLSFYTFTGLETNNIRNNLFRVSKREANVEGL
jgi:hypothetical protein